MARYDDTFVNRFLEPRNRYDVNGALGLMTRRLHLGSCERPRAAWHPPHRADPVVADRGGVYPHLISRGTIIPKRGPSR